MVLYRISSIASQLSFYKAILRAHDQLRGNAKESSGGMCMAYNLVLFAGRSLLADMFPQEKGPLAFDLIDHLLREGHKVIVIGDLQMDASRNLKTLSNLFNLELTKQNPLQPLRDISNIDQMYHLACPTRDQYEEDPIQALESCFTGTKNLLDVALRCNARVILATRSNLNEASREQPPHASWDDRLRRKRKRSTEDPQLSKPAAKRRRTQTMAVRSTSTSFYEEGNRLAEMLCSAYEQHFGLEVRIAHVPEARQQSSKHKDGDGRVLDVIAPANETPVDSADTTLVENNPEDDVLHGLVGLMEAPSPGKAASSKARRKPGAVS